MILSIIYNFLSFAKNIEDTKLFKLSFKKILPGIDYQLRLEKKLLNKSKKNLTSGRLI